MSILAASTSLSRYRILTDVLTEHLQAVPEALLKNRMLDIDATAEIRSFGWTNIDDMLDTEWQTSPPEKAHLFTFALRLDTRRIPPSVIKKHFAMAEKEALQRAKAEGKNFISRERKKELKEQVILKLRTRSLPVPAVFDVLWDTRSQIVYLESTNAKVKEMFESLFQASFSLQLEPLTPFYLGQKMLGEENTKALESLDYTHFA